MNIQEANGLTLRPALDILCGLDESTETPTGISATNILSAYSGNAKITTETPVITLMDLAGNGFLNNGNAKPVTSGAVGGKYGYISSDIADSSGAFTNDMTVTFSASKQWDYYSFEAIDQDGEEYRIDVENPTWSGSSSPYTTTYTFTSGIPNERLRVFGIKLGKSWRFTRDTLISATLSLRAVSTAVDSTELQMSEIEIKAYEPNDYTNVIGRVTKGAPIWVRIGYFDDDDATDLMKFYLSDTIDWESNIITIKGADATLFLEDNYAGLYQASTYADIRSDYFDVIKGILTDAGISYSQKGTPITGTGSTAVNLFLPNHSKRTTIATAVNLYRDSTTFAVGYVDAGIPTLSALGSTEAPATVSATNVDTDYANNAKFLSDLDYKRVMDLSGTGFLNDGGAEPITDEAITGKYGYISDICEASGSFLSVPTFTFTVTNGYHWDGIALMVADKDGRLYLKSCNVSWSGSNGTVTLNEWIPNERAYICSGIFGNFWEMSDDDCSDFKASVELNTNSIESILYSASLGTSEEIISQDVEANQQYWLDFSEPILPSSLSIGVSEETTAGGTFPIATPYKALFACTSAGELKVMARKIILSSTASDNPYTATEVVGGDTVTLDDNFLFTYEDGSLTEDAIDSLLARSNVTYSFTYRGNPKIRPRDLVYYTKQNGENIWMSIESVTHELSEGGGFTSKIEARKGII